MFRYKRSIPVEYDLQGYIYFTSRLYRELPKGKQAKIRKLCEEAAGEYADALMLFVTTDTGKAEVCAKYFISESTLERVVRRYYLAFKRCL
ncbi:hypothetical protein MR626_01800 [bacterium]|nr:hypothetical protein [bacterium]MDY4581622.1 hypothetical protein [Candidatus Faecousia sp.]